MKKRFIAITLAVLLVFASCTNIDESNKNIITNELVSESKLESKDRVNEESVVVERNDEEEAKPDGEIVEIIEVQEDSLELLEFRGLDDANLHDYVKENVYTTLVRNLDREQYIVDNIDVVYVSEEYIEELAYNSQINVFFGYTLGELDEQYGEAQYAFGLGEDGATIVYELEDYDDTYEQVVKDVAVGTGVILICVTVSAVSGGVCAATTSMIFAASAKTGSIFAVSSGAFGGIVAGTLEGIETGDFDEALKAGVSEGAKSFKWGAITGVFVGGIKEAVKIKGLAKLKSTYNERLSRTPINGKWLGKRGESIFMPDDPAAKKLLEDLGLKGIKYKNGIPDFKPISKAEFKINMTTDRSKNFAQGDELLANLWGISKKEAAQWRTVNGFSWHELNDMKTIQLVPTEVNAKCTHLGGIAEVKRVLGL